MTPREGGAAFSRLPQRRRMIFSRDHVRKGDVEYQKGNLQRAAELYLKAKRPQQAAGVYAELGKIEKAVEIYVGAGHPRLAAELLDAEGRNKEAISMYDEAGAYVQAAKICLKLHQMVRAGRLFEKAKLFRRAAEAFTEAGEIEHALRAWETASETLRAQRAGTRDHALEKKIRELDSHRAEILSNVGRHVEAADLMKEHGQTAKAATLYERGGQFTQAAEAFLGAGRVTAALAAIEKAPEAEDELRAEIYLNCARHEEAGEIFERMGKLDAAASAYEGAEAWAKAAVLWENAEAYGRAAEFFSRVERFQDAGRCYAMADQHERAAEAFARAGNDQSAADAFMAAGEQLRAGEHYLEAGQATAARDAFQAVRTASGDYGAASVGLIPLLIDEGLLEAARQRFERLGGEAAAGIEEYELRYCEGRIEEARGHFGAAEKSYQLVLAQRHDFRDVAARLADVRGKIGAGSSGFFHPEAATMESPRKDPLRGTAPVELEPLGTRSGALTRQSSSQKAATGSRPQADATSLPFDLGDRIEPWWSGAEFFRAEDLRKKKPILLVSFPLAEVASRVERFRQAMREVAALRHPTILKLDETIMASDKVLLVYEAFTGETLGNLLTVKRLPAITSLNLIVQLAEALATAHKLGVTHQWVSPRTVLIDETGRLKLVGIGLRDVLADRDATSQAYLSPEVREEGVVGPASDVYSVGLLAVELLQAQMPAGWADRPKPDPNAVEWPDEVMESVPRAARHLLVRALARDPLIRPTAAELAAALSSAGLVPGQMLAGRYEILGELGRGGMSRVYRARDRDLDDVVAIKTVLTPALARDEDEERLVQEVKICRRISHSNVVRVHDFGRFPGGIFVTMELLEGPGLDAVIREEAPLEVGRVRTLLREISAALAEAHRLEIIHRDLKPSNVILVDGRVKVLDFGIARMGDSAATSHLTRTGEVVGSPMFMAPEQIQGQPLAGTSDLYALGVIAYTLLAGREPFIADTTTAVVLKHLHEPPPDIRELRPELDDGWVVLLDKLLAKKPKDRYQSAEELTEALEGL
ncbi:MAG: protein kinase [bacterium]|nr:protein kinase [bacterium]